MTTRSPSNRSKRSAAAPAPGTAKAAGRRKPGGASSQNAPAAKSGTTKSGAATTSRRTSVKPDRNPAARTPRQSAVGNEDARPGTARAHQSAAEQLAWTRRVAPALPGRGRPPQLAVLHLGPTNSGKTYDALAALAAAGAGVYAAPLRQLAHEAYAKLSAMCPPGTVGLATGEEEIDLAAPIICATVEKAPTSGELLVLDEAHWVTDPERGHHWSRLALAGTFRELHVIAAPEAQTALSALLSDAQTVEVRQHVRLGTLDNVGALNPGQVEPATLVVAFSRKAVYAAARMLSASRPGKVGVLYGALPPGTRRDVIAQFTAGELEVLVTTDVVGHGINIPARTVLFAETTKFDGVQRRSLHTWEAAQIAGRAGRFGLTEKGSVGVLRGVTGLDSEPRLVADAIRVARGEKVSDLPQQKPRIRPELADLGRPGPREFSAALTSWSVWAQTVARERGVQADDLGALLERVLVLRRGDLAVLSETLSSAAMWSMLTLAVDYQPPRRTRWLDLSRATLEHLAGRAVDPARILTPVPRVGAADGAAAVEALEMAAAVARDAQTLLRAFPGVGGLVAADAAKVEAQCAQRITALLPQAIAGSSAGRCSGCQQPCPPWFDTCQGCYRDRR